MTVVAVIMIVAAYSCGDSGSFSVEGHLSDGRSMNIRYIYYDLQGNVLRSGVTASREGKFFFTGTTKQPAVVELTDNDYRILGYIYARNGDKIKVTLTPGNPFAIKAEGNEMAERWSRFLSEKSENSVQERDDAIKTFITTHPDDELSALLLLYNYAGGKDSKEVSVLLDALSTESLTPSVKMSVGALSEHRDSVASSRPVVNIPYISLGDSIVMFRTSGHDFNLLALNDRLPGRYSEELKDSLEMASKKVKGERLQIIELYLGADDRLWNSAVRSDTVEWLRGYMAGALSAPGIESLMVEGLPYFILADKEGRQLYRGNSLDSVITRLETL